MKGREGLGHYCCGSSLVPGAAVGRRNSDCTYFQLAQVGSPGAVHKLLPVLPCKEAKV